MAKSTMSLAEVASTATTGDLLLFRGRSLADKVIRSATNSPVNHVSMVVALDDLPPLLWHAELGSSLEDVWAGERRRGTQLHRLEDAVRVWCNKYGQTAFLREIDQPSGEPVVTRAMEDELLRVVNELGGRHFPRTASLAKRWLLGRIGRSVRLEDLFCAEVVAITYERMGLLETKRPANWYDPGRFWSGDRLELVGASLGREIKVTDVDPGYPGDDRPRPEPSSWRSRLVDRARSLRG